MELTLDQALQRGMEAHKEGKLQDAELLYRAILQVQPQHPGANHNLGEVAVALGKPLEAIPLFKLALKANPQEEQFWLSYIDTLIKTGNLNAARVALADAQQAGVAVGQLRAFEEPLGYELSASSNLAHQPEAGSILRSTQGDLSTAISLRESGKYKEAQEWLSEVIKHNPSNPEALSLLSHVLLLDDKEVEAEETLRAAASIEAELSCIYRNQARLLLKQSKPAEALERAKMACNESTEDSESLLVLAACLGANQKDPEALALIEEILEVNPKYAEAYASRAIINLRSQSLVNAIRDAETALSIKPHLTQIWQLLGSLHHQNGDLSSAIEALRNGHKQDPKHAPLMVTLGELLRQRDEMKGAIEILKRATELAPENDSAWTNLGVALQQQERIAEAKAAYEKGLALNPKSAVISNNLGGIAQKACDWESALKHFERALQIEPSLAGAHNNLGITLKELGRLSESEASCKQAIRLKPDYAEAHNNLGITLKALGRLNEAGASFRQAIALKPSYAMAMHNLSEVYSYTNNLEAEIASLQNLIQIDAENFGLIASVNLAICNFLEGDFESSREHLLAAADIQEKRSSEYKNATVYWGYLSKILKWHEKKHLVARRQKNDETLYILGESHSLTSHHLRINNSGIDFFCIAKLIKGCKQWHLGNAFTNKYKHRFESIFCALPKHSHVLLAFGEIDCRLEAGIIFHNNKFPKKPIKEIIQTTINSYLTYVTNNNVERQHRIIIQGVPCPNININDQSQEDVKRLAETIKVFNYELRTQSKDRGFGFLDTHQLTNKGDGLSNGSWHIDGYHLSPEGMREAWKRYVFE